MDMSGNRTETRKGTLDEFQPLMPICSMDSKFLLFFKNLIKL